MSHKARTFQRNFPHRLRDAREMRGFDQSSLASRVGVKPSAISHFEKGRRMPSVDTLLSLADALNVPVAFLTGRDHEGEGLAPSLQQLLDAAAKLSERDLQTITSLANDLAKRK